MAGKTKEQKAADALLAKAIELSGETPEAFASLADEARAGFMAKAQEAFDAEAQKKADEKAAGKGQKSDVDDSHLVKVIKDGQELAVHPNTLDAHKAVGWRQV